MRRTECEVTRGEVSNSGVVLLYVVVGPKVICDEASSLVVQVMVALVSPGVAVTDESVGAVRSKEYEMVTSSSDGVVDVSAVESVAWYWIY